MIVIHAAFPIDPANREAALEQVADLAEQSRAEEGVVDYRATTEVGDPSTVRIFEQYEDDAAFEAHLETDHYQAFEAAAPEFLAGEPTVHRFAVDSVTELEL